MLYLVVGPACAGKSTLIAGRLQARRLPPAHAMLAREAGRMSPDALAAILRDRDPLYIHFSVSLVPADLGPAQRAFWERTAGSGRPARGLIIVADPASLLERAARRTDVEPSLRPSPRTHHGAPRRRHSASSQVEGLDVGAFAAAWAAELEARGLRYRVVDTTPGRRAAATASS
jgi:hypothetical protein